MADRTGDRPGAGDAERPDGGGPAGGDGPAARPGVGIDPDAWTVRLARSLRDAGVPCTVRETLAARTALAHLDLSDVHDVYFGLRSVFVSDPAHADAFDRCFWDAWGQRQRGAEAGDADEGSAREQEGGDRRPDGSEEEAGAADRSAVERLRFGARRREGGRGDDEEDADDDAGDDRRAARTRFSPDESLARRSFASLEAGELRRVEEALDDLALELATRESRRWRPAGRRGRIDLRRSFREAVAHEGQVLRPARRRRRVDRPRIVLLCDVSGSMERYSRFLLRFLLAAGRDRDVETFVFSTRLTRLTDRLRRAGPDRVLEELSEWVPDWSGGTRIGASLDRFLAEHGRALLDQRTVVVILSDGLDRGEVDDLEHAMRGIRRRTRKVIWLNPLLATRGYEPEARGMKAALPHVDEFVPGHSLEALRELARLVRL